MQGRLLRTADNFNFPPKNRFIAKQTWINVALFTLRVKSLKTVFLLLHLRILRISFRRSLKETKK